MRVLSLFILIFIIRFGFPKNFHTVHGGVYTHSSLIFQLKAEKDGQSPSERARQIAIKLNAMKLPQPVVVMYEKNQAKIKVGKITLIRINADEAKAYHQSIKKISENWAKKLRKICSVSRLVQTKNKKKEKSRPALSTERLNDLSYLFSALYESKKDFLPAPDGVVDTNFSDRKVSPKAQIEVIITGQPASAENIEKAAFRSIRSRLKPIFLPKVEISLSKFQPLAMGQSYSSKARLKVVDSGRSQEGVVDLLITNKMLSFLPEQALWYSNEPENINSPGLLGMVELKTKDPLRILSHHINRSSYPILVQMVACNLSSKVAKVVVASGEGAPHTDPVRVGLAAGHKFMRSWMNRQGEIIEIDPGQEVPIFMKKLWPRQTMSGLARVELLGGGPDQLLLKSEASFPYSSSQSFPVTYASRTMPQRLQLSKHIYKKPFQTMQANYQYGGRFEFIQIGAHPLSNSDDTKKLAGNFGVIYHIQANLSNPTSKQAEIEIAFEASAGYSGAIFVIDGKLVRPQLLQSKREFLISKIRLASGAKKSIQVMTIPLSGSSYPAMMTIRPKGGR